MRYALLKAVWALAVIGLLAYAFRLDGAIQRIPPSSDSGGQFLASGSTRLYLSSTAFPDKPFTFVAWNDTTEGIRRRLNDVKGASAVGDGDTIDLAGASLRDLDRQHISRPLSGAQSIRGRVRMYMGARELGLADDLFPSAALRVFQPSGSVRCTLLTLADYNAFELGTGNTNRSFFQGDLAATCAAQDGDYIVMETGYSSGPAGSGPQGISKFGESAADCQENEVQTAACSPWLEFSEVSLTFQATAAPTGVRMYLSDNAAGATPGFDAGWNDTSEGLRRQLNDVKGASALITGSTINVAANQRDLDRQFVSDALSGANTLTGELRGSLLTTELATSDDLMGISMSLRIVDSGGATICTALSLGEYGTSTEYSVTPTFTIRRVSINTILADCTGANGNRIVLEIGHKAGAGTTPQGQGKYGESVADCAENETATADCSPWIEFSNMSTLNFQP